MGRSPRTVSHFLKTLHGGGVLLMDGAMGTELRRAGLPPGECCESWNLTHPEKVRAIHEAYWQAGARCLLTNTFQSNPAALARHGLDDRLEAINRAAVALCRTVGSGQAFVLGSVGPMSPAADTARVLTSLQGADAILLETWSEPWVFDFAGRMTEQPVLVSISYQHTASGLVSRSGHQPEHFAQSAEVAAIAALGVNCGRDIDLDDIIAILRAYRAAARLPLFARPNAGTPQTVMGGLVYPLTPGALAERMHELVEAGATMIGGCCGTTPAHIAALASSNDT
jgi:methionine synthase I (cobalamin-dependent)